MDIDLEREILTRMINYYHDTDRANKWYKTPNQFFSYDNVSIATPKQMVDNGEGNQVLEWIRLTIGEH